MNFTDDDIQFLGGRDLRKSRKPLWKRLINSKWAKAALAVIVLVLCAAVGLHYYRHHYWAVDFDYPLSRSCSEIIADMGKLQKGSGGYPSFTTDSIDGVRMRFYDLSGLKASIAREMPADSDTTVCLVTQAWDYYFDDDKQYHYLGEFIKDGEQLRDGKGRAGFVMATQDGWQMGISQSDSITEYVISRHGSMFRQFALVSAGQICLKQFALKGKVRRRALARKAGSPSAWFVETLDRESLYDFAEALSDYGFSDAVYLTGADETEPYYRDSSGKVHSDAASWKQKTNLLVFRLQ